MFKKSFFEKHSDKLYQTKAPSNSNQKNEYLTKKEVIDRYEFLKDYYFEENLIGKK